MSEEKESHWYKCSIYAEFFVVCTQVTPCSGLDICRSFPWLFLCDRMRLTGTLHDEASVRLYPMPWQGPGSGASHDIAKHMSGRTSFTRVNLERCMEKYVDGFPFLVSFPQSWSRTFVSYLSRVWHGAQSFVSQFDRAWVQKFVIIK